MPTYSTEFKDNVGNRQLYTVTLSRLGVFFSHLINQM